jgi:predicted RNA-binding Zn-ribbon protein involved in translation (DUF1610 family)
MQFSYVCPECGKVFGPASFVWRCAAKALSV